MLLSLLVLLRRRGEMTEDEIRHATTLGFTGPIWDGEQEQTSEQVIMTMHRQRDQLQRNHRQALGYYRLHTVASEILSWSHPLRRLKENCVLTACLCGAFTVGLITDRIVDP